MIEQVHEPSALSGQFASPAVKALLGVIIHGGAAKVTRPLKTSAVPKMSRQTNSATSHLTVKDIRRDRPGFTYPSGCILFSFLAEKTSNENPFILSRTSKTKRQNEFKYHTGFFR